MNKPKVTFLIFTFVLVGLFGSTFSFAQAAAKPLQQAEPSFEVIFQILTASNAAGRDGKTVPQTLANVIKKLKTTYSLSSYQLVSTHLHRIADTGSVQFSSVSNLSGQNQEDNVPVFLEWSIGQLRSLPDEKGEIVIQLQNFRYGLRIPIRTVSNVVNYEQFGLTMQKLSLPKKTPTVIGNLPASKHEEIMFLVITVNPTD